MPLTILKWKNQLQKVRRIHESVRRICKLCLQNFQFLTLCRILTTLDKMTCVWNQYDMDCQWWHHRFISGVYPMPHFWNWR